MMTIITAAWRVVVKRTLHDWLILAAAFITILLATTLLATGPIYAGAVTLSGVRRTLHDAPIRDANVEVTVRSRGGNYRALDDNVVAVGSNAFAPTGGPIYRSGRSESFALPGQDPEAVTDLTVFAFYEAIEPRASLVEGVWPPASPDPAPVQAALSESAASLIGVSVGDTLSLQSRREKELFVDVVVSGIYRVTDPSDPYWWEDPLALDGVQPGESFTTYGPFVVEPGTFLSRVTSTSAELNWRIYPTVDNLTVSEVDDLRRNVESLEGQLNFGRAANDRFTVDTDLDDILRRAERSLLVTRSGVLILTVQLAILAGYALLLTSGLLIEQRRVETALLRSRGADSNQVAMMALMEGLLLVIPATIFGPWLAAVSLRILNVVGPLADIELSLNPVVTREAYALAFFSGIACVIALVVPALRSARTFTQARSERGRQGSQGLAQRAGLDLVLLAVAALAYWQLRRYGAPITETVRGRLDLDPFLIAAPAIGLLAGAVVALRVVPLLAQVAERVAVKRPGLVPSLGAWQLARRPLRYARSALLLMLALAIGLFAVSYSRTWTRSQQDQADYQVGADIRLRPDIRIGSAIPQYDLADAYGKLDGVGTSLPMVDDTLSLSRSAGSATMLAIDASRATEVVNFRDDLADASLDELLAPLAEQRPTLASNAIPGSPQRLALDVRITADEVSSEHVSPDAFPDGLPSLSPNLNIVIQDATGMLYRIGAGAFPDDGEQHRLIVDLAHVMSDGQLALPQYPLALIAVDLRVSPMAQIPRTGTFQIVALSASDALDGESWQPVALPTDPPGWTVSNDELFGSFTAPSIGNVNTGAGAAFSVDFDAGSVVEDAAVPTLFRLAFGANELTEPIPAIVNLRFMDLTETGVGETLPVELGRDRREVALSGAVNAFPPFNPDNTSLVVVDLPTFMMYEFATDGVVYSPDEWWLDVDEGRSLAVSETLREAPYSSPRVQDRLERGRALRTDPVALGIIGALSLGFVAAALFATIGFAVSAAVSARERLTEFALLRALGLSTGQLSSWLSIENGILVAISITGGTVLGLLLAWLILPLVSITQEAAAVVPGVVVTIPWPTILMLEALTLFMLVIVVATLATALRRLGLGSVLRLGEE